MLGMIAALASRYRIALAALLLTVTIPVAYGEGASAGMTAAANNFLATLDAKQRQSVLYAFADDEQRRRWSNLPTPMVPRGGINLGSMSATQRAAAMTLLSTALSARGFQKVTQIMQGDEVNRQNEPGRRGGGSIFGKDLYYVSILGLPSDTTPWMLQFGGHHLALNITVAGKSGILTPTLTGAQPAFFMADGKPVRPLAGESDRALALLNSLDAGQRGKAILSYTVADLVLGPGEDGRTIQPEGLKASAMNEQQKAMLLNVITEWSDIVEDRSAASRTAELKADLNDTWFAWSGPTTVGTGGNIVGYYRIQGPHLVIEYAPQRLGGDPALHVHTMYRDPTNDYGRAVIAK